MEKTGQTYRVIWIVGGTRYVGTGIGDKDFLAVSYMVGSDTGLALYGADGGNWAGVWTYADGRRPTAPKSGSANSPGAPLGQRLRWQHKILRFLAKLSPYEGMRAPFVNPSLTIKWANIAEVKVISQA